MVKFNVHKIKKDAELDYEKTWLETANLLKQEGRYFNLQNKRKENDLVSLIFKVRNTLLDIGFTEAIVPVIIEKGEVYLQYGPEAPVILDRIFFLAGLDRPDIGVSEKRIEEIKKIVPSFKDIEKLQGIFRKYKKGKIASDDLVERMVNELKIKEEQATRLLNEVFKELKDLQPLPLSMTLRSHTTAGWFGVLQEYQNREPLPIQLFSIGPKYRREQKLDATHLYDSQTASIVIMADEFSVEDGLEVVRQIFAKLGFEKVSFTRKTATSKYYAPQTEYEIFVKHPHMEKMLEIGDAGFYSPVPLSKYKITHPVWNFGFGLERMLMILSGENDIRKVVYPYMYQTKMFSSQEVANSIKMIDTPKSNEGKNLANLIYETAVKHANDPTPAKVTAFDGKIMNKKLIVKIVKNEEKKRLLGPAALNPIVVKDSNIIGAMPNKIPEDALKTPYSYMMGLANKAAYEIEQAAAKGEKEVVVEAKMIRSLTDVNMEIDDAIRRFLRSNKKTINVIGPMFVWVTAKIEDHN
ncbi:MAG: O-phosphoserine--tRNA ligase [Candidatus Bathyarchaeia archaeon]